MSFWRSESFCCRADEFCCTAAFAWSDACAAWRLRALRFSTSDSSWISRLANDSAACVYSEVFAVLPDFVASSAINTAWRALVLTFSNSSIARLSRISVCFWLAITLAACSRNRRCCSCASMIACSSCTFGSARSLNEPDSFAVMYFNHRRSTLNMWGRLPTKEPLAQAAHLFDLQEHDSEAVDDHSDHN